MIAAVRSKYGQPEVLRIKDLEMPTTRKNQVLIRVYATTVNRTDCHILWGKPLIMRLFTGIFKPRLASTGSDFAGQVVAIGEQVQKFKVGDRVMGFGGVFGCGSHRQYISIPETKSIVTIPQSLNYEEAAASLEGAVYAFGQLQFNIEPGHKVLVIGATGAIGSSLVQIIKSFGSQITAVCHGKDIKLVHSLGADVCIDFTKQDFTKTRDTYDFIFDAVGKSSFEKCKLILKKNGIYSSAAPNLLQSLTTKITGGKKEIFSPLSDTNKALNYIKELVEKGRFRAVIDRTYPLEKIVEAYHYVATGQKIGNVVLTIYD